MVLCRVLLLDGSDFEMQVDQKDIGQTVFDKVCEHLSLLEKDYFGCTFREKETKFWLRLDKKLSKQISGTWILTFAVKYYPPAPGKLHEELTRYLLFLQLERDVSTGRLPCSFVTQALLSSYSVQSQIGDYDEDEHGEGIGYLQQMFNPSQTEEMLEKIAELHKTHKGDSPAMAEMAYLENAKNLAMYGVHMHPVKEENGTDLFIGVCAIGLLTYKDRLRTNRFAWARIIKISFKRDKFFIKLRPEENERKGIKLTYKLVDVARAKLLWQLAVDHHMFFRMSDSEFKTRRLFSRGGAYVYTGRTYQQALLAGSMIQRAGQDFTRASSLRYTSTKSLNALTSGNMTERAEHHIAEDAYKTATLNLKGFGSSSSMPFRDNGHDSDAYSLDEHGARYGGYEPVIAGMVDQYGMPIRDPNQNVNLNGQNYGGNPSIYYDTGYGHQVVVDPQGRNGTGLHMPNWSRSQSTASVGSGELSPRMPGNPPKGQPRRDQYGNIIITKNYAREGKGSSIASSQDDHLLELDEQTSKRTYTTPNGTIITEYRTVRNGIVETRIEKRTRQTTEYEDDFDYDEALARAIRDVTDMNPNLAVEKIEIHTKSEETMA